MRVGFFEQSLPLDLQLQNAPFDLVDLYGKGIELHAQSRCCFVHQINGLVREKTVGDVTLRKCSRGKNGRVLDAHAMMQLVAIFEAAQNRDGIFDRRLGNQHRLEAPFECRVLLNVLAVLVYRRGADSSQFAAGQRRLQHVRGVHRAFRRARTDQCVQFVDEEDDLPFGFGDLFEHRFQTVLEFAAILRACHQRR